MRVIEARNVCHAYVAGMQLLEEHGRWEETRNGAALVAPWPVATVYARPDQRVLLAPGRVPNPVFHLFEALWMLAGRDDATFLDQFVSDFSARFAEPDTGRQHGAYGARWRKHFILCYAPDTGETADGFHVPNVDQLNEVVRQLRTNPESRRAVIQMWCPEDDLGADKRDVPCNLTALPRIVDGRLNLTVFCRSNDAVWGAYGANAVHFSVLQEYLAARIGVGLGTYTQVSNNLHVYEDQLRRTPVPAQATDVYADTAVRPMPMVTHPDSFDDEVRKLLDGGTGRWPVPAHNLFLRYTAEHMWVANHYRKEKNWAEAQRAADRIAAPDWRLATQTWLRALEAKQ